MTRKNADDHKRTNDHIPTMSHEFSQPLKQIFQNLETRSIHEGRVVFPDFADLTYIQTMFSMIGFECLLGINEEICPHFMLEFYSQFSVVYSDDDEMCVQFVFQNQICQYTLEEFASLLGVPCQGICVFSNKWPLNELVNGVCRIGKILFQYSPYRYHHCICSRAKGRSCHSNSS